MAYAAAVVGWGSLLLPSQSDTVALERSSYHRGAHWGHGNAMAQGICSASGGVLAGKHYVQIPWLHSLSFGKDH